jgi:hypothetical protein
LLEQVIKQTAMLPLRYGTTFADERALTAAVAAREGPLRAALERVRGAVEIAVRAPAEHRQPARSDGMLDEAPSSPGRAFMLERLAARERGRKLELELERAMDGLVRARAARGEGAHALLVEHAHVGEVARRARTLGLIASGPWPPFSFTGEAGAASEQWAAAGKRGASAAGKRWASAAGERWASAPGERWACAPGSRK